MKKCLHKKKTKNRRAKPLPPTTNKKPVARRASVGSGIALAAFAAALAKST